MAARALQSGRWGHGTVVVALEQTHGKGRRGNTWRAAKGLDLTASFIVEPRELGADRQFALAQCAALAVHGEVVAALRQAGCTSDAVRVKWPNDVLIGPAKVAGILIANELRGMRIRSSIIGIGINVNSLAHPQETKATSLRLITGTTHEPDTVLNGLCAGLQHWLEVLEASPDTLGGAYGGLLWGRDQWMPFLLDGRAIKAKPLAVEPTGWLRVEDEHGRVAAYDMDRLRAVR